MIRKIIQIDEEKCNGCGACASACHEGAIAVIDGKAKLIHEDYCDGLGDCLPQCPTDAITFIEKEIASAPSYTDGSQLRQWPCQIKLVPVCAPYFDGARLLLAADCTAYAYEAIHRDYMRGRVTLIGCPKLDAVDYSEKLTQIIKNNNIKDVLILRMEVPCCGGLEHAAKKALQDSGKFLPWQVVTISTKGEVLDY